MSTPSLCSDGPLVHLWIIKIAEFTVQKEALEECIEAIRAFVQEVKDHEPNTLMYESYQKPDGVSFIHFMSFKNTQAETKHTNSSYVKKFTGTLYPRCQKKTTLTDLTVVQ